MSRRIVYDVAVSVDGYIADAGDGFRGFLFQGDHVDAYQKRLAGYDTVLMGRRTYEAGYAFGMSPGDLPYPGKRHVVFSRTLSLPANSDVELVRTRDIGLVEALRSENGGDVYVSGGGQFAGWLAANRLLDTILLKINPVILGDGVPLLGSHSADLRGGEFERYESGVVLARYEVA